MKRSTKIVACLVVLIVVVVMLVQHKSQSPATNTSAPKTVAEADDKPAPATKFNKFEYSTTDPASPWIVVNKQRPLVPQDYAPVDLVDPNLPARTGDIKVRKVMLDTLRRLFDAADQNGTPLRLSSGYRSYSYQVGLYNGYVKTQGQAVADSQSARPGFSEHQTGLAVDVSPEAGNCSVQACFASTPAGQWLAVNAYKYGFIIRYADGLTPITGYTYEPWHIRYVGDQLANEMHTTNVPTLERFFSLGDAPNY